MGYNKRERHLPTQFPHQTVLFGKDFFYLCDDLLIKMEKLLKEATKTEHNELFTQLNILRRKERRRISYMQMQIFEF